MSALQVVRILLLEDDPTFAKLLQAQLRTLGAPRCEVVRVANLADATRKLATEHFDLILTDMGLPDSHGPKTVETLAQAAKGTPLVVLSGSDQAPPGWPFLRKGGVTPTELAQAIREAMG
jgi:CheY-like chemotaxis protein